MAPKMALVANGTTKDKTIVDENTIDKITSDKNTTDKNTNEKSLIWSCKMDDALIDAFMHELDSGNKIGGSFTTTAYDNITKSLSALFGFKVDKDKVKNRWKTLKKNFGEIYDIFKGGMTGFSWNPSINRWEAEDQVWDQLIEVKPKAANWKNKSLPNYEKMLSLYGIDRANGEEGDTAAKMKKRRHENSEESNAGDNDKESDVISLDGHSIGDSSRSKRNATSKDKDPFQIQLLAEKMDVIASVLSEGNKIFQARYAPQISGEETLKMIQESGFEEEKIPRIYNFLMNDVAKLRAVIQCPLVLRKSVIMDMVFSV